MTWSIDEWLAAEVGMVPPLVTSQVAGGLSNVTLVVTDAGGRRVVVRRPPDGHHAGGAHDVLREARIMNALASSDVPVPEVMGWCDAGGVSEVPFYVMDHVDGVVVDSLETMSAQAPHERRRLGFELIDVLVALQHVDLDAPVLADMRRSTPYLQRQVRRWKAQWEATSTRELPALERVTRRLESVLPALEDQPDCFVHGDFRFGNVMIDASPTPQILALLDWELATTGHPLADLGFIGARMNAPDGVLASNADPLSAPGCPTYDELAADFATKAGLSTTDLPVFVALAAWRWAIIVEGIAARFARGQMGELREDAAWHRRRVELLAGLAAEWLG